MLQVFGSRSCVHCRSVIDVLRLNSIPFEFVEMKEETDVVRVVDAGVTYTGLDEVMNHLHGEM